MGQPSGGWRKSEGDEKKREGALEIEGESWRDVCGGVMGNISVCVCVWVFLCVCSRVGQARLRCRQTVQLSYSGMLLNTLMSNKHTHKACFATSLHTIYISLETCNKLRYFPNYLQPSILLTTVGCVDSAYYCVVLSAMELHRCPKTI